MMRRELVLVQDVAVDDGLVVVLVFLDRVLVRRILTEQFLHFLRLEDLLVVVERLELLVEDEGVV